jgi:hypothetical protein
MLESGSSLSEAAAAVDGMAPGAKTRVTRLCPCAAWAHAGHAGVGRFTADYRRNSALTDRFSVIVTTQVPLPLQPLPFQSTKLLPVAGVAVKVTVVPVVNGNVQTTPQLMPEGLLVIVPAPFPLLLTVSTFVLTVGLNCATTV